MSAGEVTREYYRNQGAKQEQARILMLLKEYIPTFYSLSPNSEAVKYPVENIIALIKGETE